MFQTALSDQNTIELRVLNNLKNNQKALHLEIKYLLLNCSLVKVEVQSKTFQKNNN